MARHPGELPLDDRPGWMSPPKSANAPTPPAPASVANPPPIPAEPQTVPAVSVQAERLAGRLVEDEALRGELTDDEFQPLLDWAIARIQALSAAGGDQDTDASRRFQAAGAQLLEVLRVADLVIGDRANLTPELIVSRLQLIDTMIAPPLYDSGAAQLHRSRLEALLAESPDRLKAIEGSELATRLADSLG